MDLKLILGLGDLTDYKFHAARYNQIKQPLDVFISDKNEWFGWNTWRGNRNDFSRKYIISFIKFYTEHETWLFGGAYKVLGSSNVPNHHSYEIEEVDVGKHLIGRLKIEVSLSRGRAFNLENMYEKIKVSEILKEPYRGAVFPGYENISLKLSELDIIYKNSRPDWQTALQNMKGVYLISDMKTGKKYVGSAYNDMGIWARWGQYLETGHGYNIGLKSIEGSGREYGLKNFKLTLIEVWPFKTADKFIIQRESFWKNALLTRGDFGYNKN